MDQINIDVKANSLKSKGCQIKKEKSTFFQIKFFFYYVTFKHL